MQPLSPISFALVLQGKFLASVSWSSHYFPYMKKFHICHNITAPAIPPITHLSIHVVFILQSSDKTLKYGFQCWLLFKVLWLLKFPTPVLTGFFSLAHLVVQSHSSLQRSALNCPFYRQKSSLKLSSITSNVSSTKFKVVISLCVSHGLFKLFHFIIQF